jgi:hypothetical protein
MFAPSSPYTRARMLALRVQVVMEGTHQTKEGTPCTDMST